MTVGGVVTGARVTHESGTVDDLAAASPESTKRGVLELLEYSAVEEAFVLDTCNRVEAYVVTKDGSGASDPLTSFFGAVDDERLVVSDHDESLEHLMRVTCGLESVVLGEDQIIGQVRGAYETARSVGAVDNLFEIVLTKAIHVGERARTETAINEGIVSLGSAAARLAKRERSLEGATALVVGAGDMGRLAARCLAKEPVAEVVVANRTVSKATHVVSELETPGTVVGLDDLESATSRADIVVSATGSDEPILDETHFDAAEGTQVVVDLGQPRDVSPDIESVSNVTVYDLDALQSITEETRIQRADAALEVEAIIERELELLGDQLKRTRADEVIGTMYESAERVKRRELETAFSRLEETELTDDQREIIASMADALVSQLLAPPTKSLREAAAEDDWQTINAALQLFDPDFGPEVQLAATDDTRSTQLATTDND